jgi:hypothetical protein
MILPHDFKKNKGYKDIVDKYYKPEVFKLNEETYKKVV